MAGTKKVFTPEEIEARRIKTAEYHKNYNLTHAEQIAAYHKAYNASNKKDEDLSPEELAAKKAKIAEYHKKYNASHKEQITNYHNAYNKARSESRKADKAAEEAPTEGLPEA
jgi:hypothetical protein